MTTTEHRKALAFTLEEMLMVVAIIGILAAIAVWALTRGRSKADRIHCVSFNKQMGTAFRVFASDNGDLYPLQAKTNNFIVPSGATAAQVNSAVAEPWQIAQTMWKELLTPRVLLCPSDRERAAFRGVRDFNGFAGAPGPVTPASLGHPTNRDKAMSYAFGVVADESRPLGVMIVDRNVNNVGIAGAEIATNVALSKTRVVLNSAVGPTQAVWVAGTRIHGLEGNLSYADGSVSQTTAEVLRQLLENAAKAYGTITNQNLMLFP